MRKCSRLEVIFKISITELIDIYLVPMDLIDGLSSLPVSYGFNQQELTLITSYQKRCIN